MINLNNISLVIFDLGGVLLNIDYKKTEQAMINLGISSFDQAYSQAKQAGLFDQFETGQVSGEYFINELERMADKPVSTEAIVGAWNAMLEDFPDKRLQLLLALKKQVKTALYSNTNSIHLHAFNDIMLSKGVGDFNSYFHKAYYSHQLGFRKPDPEGFRLILNQMDTLADRTVFIDDSMQHVEGARRLGIHAIHLPVDDIDVIDLFPDITL